MGEQKHTDHLVQQASRGDPVALEELLERFLPDLETFVRLRAGARIRAKESSADLVQSVCREVLQDLDSIEYQGERAFKRWLFLTSERKIKDRDRYWRRARRDSGREAEPVPEGPAHLETPEAEMMRKEDLQKLEWAFAQLPEDYRNVITLSRHLGMTHTEIAEEIGRTPAATRVLLHRALARLGVLLDETE